jgi:hypothetical protein
MPKNRPSGNVREEPEDEDEVPEEAPTETLRVALSVAPVWSVTVTLTV